MTGETDMKSFGVIVITHGRICEEIVAVAIHIMGAKLPRLTAFSVPFWPRDVCQLRAALRDQIASLDSGGGVLILTDVVGGTPTNLARSLSGEARVGIVAGVNLPMLLKLPRIRELPLNEAVEVLAALARKTILAVNVDVRETPPDIEPTQR